MTLKPALTDLLLGGLFLERTLDDDQHKMENARDIDELRRLEQLCLEQAEEAGTPEGRAALLSMAADYRAAAERSAQPDRDQ